MILCKCFLTSQASQELMAPTVVLAFQGVMALMGRKVNRENQAHLDQLGQWDLKDHQVTLDHKDSMDHQDLQVQTGAMVSLDVKEDGDRG